MIYVISLLLVSVLAQVSILRCYYPGAECLGSPACDDSYGEHPDGYCLDKRFCSVHEVDNFSTCQGHLNFVISKCERYEESYPEYHCDYAFDTCLTGTYELYIYDEGNDEATMLWVCIEATAAPTTLPTNSPTEQHTDKACDAVREWTKEEADSNCIATSFPSKSFGIEACKARYQKRLEMSLANKLYSSCGSRCVYDYKSIMDNGIGAFLYRRVANCYKFVTRGGCFKLKYGQVMGRAKMLCSN